MTQSQHMQKSPKKIWATFPMLNFSRWTPTLGASLKWNDQKRPKLAHFGIFRHIGGVGGVRKNVDLKIQWVKGNCSKNCGYWASWGPTIIFSQKKYKNPNPVTLTPMYFMLIMNLFSIPTCRTIRIYSGLRTKYLLKLFFIISKRSKEGGPKEVKLPCKFQFFKCIPGKN